MLSTSSLILEISCLSKPPPYEGGADDPFLDVGECFADAGGFLVNLPEASSGVLVFVDPFCVRASTCSGLGK